MLFSQRLRLDLNNAQHSWLGRCAGAARFTYNWGLARWNEIYAASEKPNWYKLNADLNARKATEFPWLQKLPWKIPNQALEDLGVAFNHFFRRMKAGERPGYPRFKKKGHCRESFAIEARALTFDGHRVKIPKLGWLRLREPLRFPGKILAARFTKHAEHWYVSIQVEVDESRWSYPHRCETQAVVGIDLGVVDLAVLSIGERIAAPRILRKLEAQLRRLNKELHRRKKGGHNRDKTRLKLARLHERIVNIRRAAIHTLTSKLVHYFRWIGVEDLNGAGMMKGGLAKSVGDAALGEVLRQLRYKAKLAGSELIIADRFYPSSKTCSTCSVVYADLSLSERRWICTGCGTNHDRDENAAKNLQNLAAAYAVTACRHGGADDDRKIVVKLPLGQELSSCDVH